MTTIATNNRKTKEDNSIGGCQCQDGNRFLSGGPVIMGILNVTPDSFYAPSRCTVGDSLRQRACQMAFEGAGILDLGACSTRPDSTPATESEELQRLLPALEVLREALPHMPLSIDTFRRSVAVECVRQFGPLLINDISGGDAALPGVPYVLTCPDANPQAFFAERIPQLLDAGVEDLYLDPGFGFGKTVDDNYRILSHLEEFCQYGYPLFVGVSRKSMIQKLLNITPAESLEGTVILGVIALQKGTSILRVHDVLPAVQSVTLLRRLGALPNPTINK